MTNPPDDVKKRPGPEVWAVMGFDESRTEEERDRELRTQAEAERRDLDWAREA